MRFDTYTFLARVSPILVLIFPAALAVFAWIPSGFTLPTTLTAIGMSVAISFFAAQLGRDNGVALQKKLWSTWGGPPTTQLLRHRNHPNPHLLARYHKKLVLLLGTPLPTAKEEQLAPEEADKLYDAATALLRQKTRDLKPFPLVFKELTNYGFRRNLYGCRPSGILISFLSTLAIALAALIETNVEHWVLCMIAASFFAFWVFRVNSDWVKIPAFAYAKSLLEASESL
jgi:hypothetical protein